MTQTPMPPAGWYPQGGQERWWDGTQWSDNIRPLQQPLYGALGPTPYAAPPAGGHVLRNVLLVIALVLLLAVGGCVAAVVVVARKVDTAVNDQTPGGPRVPKTIRPGQAFSIRGLDHAAGWALADDATGDADVTSLTVTNHRGKADYVLVHIDVRQGGTVLATVRCTTSSTELAQGATEPLSCYGDRPLPASYDRVTIMDDF